MTYPHGYGIIDINMSVGIDPNLAHEQGLEACTEEKDYERALALYADARSGFSEQGSLLDVGRVDRDLARVYAGLGRPALRDLAIQSAFDKHWDIFTHTDNVDAARPASELAATRHVQARIILAKYVESGQRDFEEMAHLWQRAHSMLNAYPGTNPDYLQQVITHGAPAITLFGRRSDLDIAERLLEDPQIFEMTDPRRQKAVKDTGSLLLARLMFVPVKFIPSVREGVIDAVAGPYISRYQID